ncbi:MAG: WYL domain-containing protein [Bacteroides sp.]|nr:WYL domain-containing protein [Bacteroides sp.]
MVDILLKRYIWLIDTLRKRGEMTYDEIASAWSHSSVNDNGSELSKRTFYNHCQAIARHFGIDIECRRGRGLNLYRISNPESIEENSLTKWVLDSFSLGELLLGNTDIADKILLEDIPSGREWLEPIIQALKQNLKIAITYKNFTGVRFSGKISPLCVKLFKRRWYVLASVNYAGLRIFALDRVNDLQLTGEKFTYPDDFVPADYFHDVFGIVAGVDNKVETIVIRTYAELPGYLRSLPMHHSQQELSTNENYTDFSIRLKPTFDFIQELLLHRDQLEVLSPLSLREEIAEIISKMKNHYEDSYTAKQQGLL